MADPVFFPRKGVSVVSDQLRRVAQAAVQRLYEPARVRCRAACCTAALPLAAPHAVACGGALPVEVAPARSLLRLQPGGG